MNDEHITMNVFKFCPNCKSQLSYKEERLIECNNCGFYYYLSPSTSNGALLENNHGEILLAKRKYEPKKDHWDLPGGFINYGETAEDSLQRELYEELGITVPNLIYLHSYVDTYNYKGIAYQALAFIFYGKISDKRQKASDDITEVAFFPKDRLPYNRIAFPSIKQALKDYLTLSQSAKR